VANTTNRFAIILKWQSLLRLHTVLPTNEHGQEEEMNWDVEDGCSHVEKPVGRHGEESEEEEEEEQPILIVLHLQTNEGSAVTNMIHELTDICNQL